MRGTAVNSEVVAEAGVRFDPARPEESLAETLQTLLDQPRLVDEYRGKVRARIERFYNWEWITDFYEELFRRLVAREQPESYDDYLARVHGVASPGGSA